MNKLLPYIMAVLVTLLGFMGWAAYEASRTLQGEEDARIQAARTLGVLSDIREVSSAVINAETGQRGYLLSQDKDYLEPYYAGRRDYGVGLQNFKAAIKGRETALQSNLIPRLEDVMEKKFTTLDKTINLVESGQLNAALSVLNTDRGKNLMDVARDYLRQLETEERKILNSALAAAERRDKRFKKYISWISAAIAGLLILSLFLIWRAAKADQAEAHIQALEAANQRTELIAKELNHRVKNLFSIVISIIRNTGRLETDAKIATEKTLDRVHALSMAHQLTISSEGMNDTTIATLVNSVVEPHKSDRHKYILSGADIVLPSTAITPLGLIIHELATNAVKYGAWSSDRAGLVSVEFKANDDSGDLNMRWVETGGAAPDDAHLERKGFGSRMMLLSAKQLDGTFESNINNNGVEVLVNFKL